MKKTREKIIDAMYDLVAERGYERASIALICEKICIKKPSVYYYFKSKEEIFLEMIDSISKDVIVDFKHLYEAKSKNEYIYALLEYGNTAILKTDIKYIRVSKEIYRLSNQMESVKNRTVKFESDYENAIRAAFWQGMHIGVFPGGFDMDLAIQMFIVLFDGIDNVINYDRGIDCLSVWTGFVNMITRK